MREDGCQHSIANICLPKFCKGGRGMGGEGGGWGGRIKMRKIDELQNGRFLKCVYSLTQFCQLVRQYQVTIGTLF